MNLLQLIFLFLTFGFYCVDGLTLCWACTWYPWRGWSSCSASCGGGTQYSERSLCCMAWWNFNQCLYNCKQKRSNSIRYRSCNNICFNGGRYEGGCKCRDGYHGSCCSSKCPLPDNCASSNCTKWYDTYCNKCIHQSSDIDRSLYWLRPDKRGCDATCSWKENWCWPGTCKNKLAKNCKCASGFFLSRREPARCDLSQKPELVSCKVGIGNNIGEVRNSTNEGGHCEKENSFFMNFQPSSISLKFDSEFSLPQAVVSITKPTYIKEFAVGVIKTDIVLRKVTVYGSKNYLQTIQFHKGNGCDKKFYQSLPISGSPVSCTSNIAYNTSWELVDGERFCLLFIAKAGGYLKTIDFDSNPSPHRYYNPTLSIHEVCAKYDKSPPIHCKERGNCQAEPIQITSRITRTSTLTVNISGWLDPYPVTPDQASGLHKYIITLHEIKEAYSSTLMMDTATIQSYTFNVTGLTQVIELPKEPALYGISVEVVDVAGNPSFARRFVLYDNSSVIKVQHKDRLRFDSASSDTNFTWQTHHGKVCLSWKNRYYNSYNIGFNVLRSIAPDHHGFYRGVYEQLTGPLPASGTLNVHGITMFFFTWSKNNQATSSRTPIPDVIQQNVCKDVQVKDGDTINITVTSIDIMDNSFSESKQVFIDASVPDINNIWIEKDGIQKLYVHNSKDLAKMKIKFDALDQHSGIHSIHWHLGTTDGGNELGTGAIGVKTLSDQLSSCRTREDCYCPDVGECQQFTYTAEFNSLVSNDKNIGKHNREYFFTLKVTNNAMLVSIEHVEILVDDSKPETGVVFEGSPHSADIDYTTNSEIMINWHGFIDHESGILKYRVGFANHCLNRSELLLDTHNLTDVAFLKDTVFTTTKIDIPTTGEYYTSLIAYNNALEPSDVVCSDGITLDRSKPLFQNLIVDNAKTSPVVGCFNNSAYIVIENLTAVELIQTDECQNVCSKSEEMALIQFLPKSKNSYNDTDVSDDICKRQNRFTDDWFIYLPSDKIFMEWDASDPESQMSEVDIGFASDSSQYVSPDLSSYVKAHRMFRYSSIHTGLDTGVPMYIMIKATNKAGLNTIVPFGPLIIDETPPEINDHPHIELDDENIIVSWNDNAFQDTEEMTALNTVLFRLGSNNRFLTPILQANIVHSCPRKVTNSTCFVYPINCTQSEDTEMGLQFYFELYVYNTVGHFSTVKTSDFMVPSKYPPGHGTVLDISSNSTDTSLDTDFILSRNCICARWEGFSHHENVTFEMGIGISKNKDNIVPFQSVSGQHACITNHELYPLLTYYTSIRATCSGGSTIVTSDGFVFINETDAITQIDVYDGAACSDESLVHTETLRFEMGKTTFNLTTILNTESIYTIIVPGVDQEEVKVDSNDVAWVKEEMQTFFPFTTDPSFSITLRNISEKIRDVKILNCNRDLQFQRSTNSYKGYWVTDQKISKFISHYDVGLSKFDNGVETVIKPLESIYDQSTVIKDVDLERNERYNLVVRACFQHICLKPVYSKGSVIELMQPIARNIGVSMTTVNKTFVETITDLEKFECASSTKAQTYLFAFSKTVTGDNQISQWYQLMGQQNATSVRFTAKHIMHLSVLGHQDIFACIRGICNSGASRTTCTKVTRKTHPNELDPTALFEFDTRYTDVESFKDFLHSKHVGQKLSVLHKNDVDFVKTDTRLSAGLINSFGKLIHWYLMKIPSLPTGSCNEDINCIQHLQSENGIVTFKRWKLEVNRKYYICAHSNSTYLDLKPTTEFFGEVDICGNGFVVDDTPPSPGRVEIKTDRVGFTSVSDVLITWNGFSDIEKETDIGYQSGIRSFSYAVGTYPGGNDICPYKHIGVRQSALLHNLHLRNGATIYASVKAYDFVGYTTVSSSSGIIVDMSPPEPGFIYVGYLRQHTYFVSSKHIAIKWDGFEDPESGIAQTKIGIGSSNRSADIKSMEIIDGQSTVVESDNRFIDGHQYFALLSVTNRAGLSRTVPSPPFVFDITPPVVGYVRDGSRTEKADVDFQEDVTRLFSHWGGFNDPHSEMLYYEVGIGTLPFQSDVEALLNVGLRTDKTWDRVFIPGTKYYITVKACNGAELCSMASSDGIILDNSPPIPGIVHVGLSDRHQNYLGHRSSLSAKWIGFQDPHSNIQHFEWCLGTSKGSCNLLQLENVLLSKSITKSGLNLPNETTMYVSVRAYNNLGLFTQRSSEAFLIDSTPPIVKRKPYFVLNKNSVSHRPNSQWERSYIQIAWEFYDLESPVTEHTIFLKVNDDGNTVINSHTISNDNSTTIHLGKDNLLKNGDRYTAWVTACNEAGLCKSAKTSEILIDASPPHLGGFKNPMTWRTVNHSSEVTEITVRWYGFVDAESEIESYYLTVSRNFSDSELANGIINVESKNSSEQMKTIRLQECLSSGENIVLSVWAINKVGLRSTIGRITVTLVANDVNQDSGFLEIQKHSCISHYCNNDCTCAVIGKKCIKTATNVSCTEIQNNSSSVFQNVQAYFGRKPSKITVTGSSLCLEGFWSVSNVNSYQVMRFEWSLGIKGENPGTGIFNRFTEKIWHDVGKYNNITYCLSNGKELEHDEMYILYVKAWYSYTEYKIFISDPVLVDMTPPKVRRGSSVIESVDECYSDVDFLNETHVFDVCWSDVFSDRHSLTYGINGGSSPYGDDLLRSVKMGSRTIYRINGSNLQPGTTYFFTVTAKNDIGLVTSFVSDGILIDLEEPNAGVVFNTKHHKNVQHQSSADRIGISWHGFDDHHSSVEYYSVSIVDVNSSTIVTHINSAGMINAIEIQDLSLEHNHSYQAKIVAVDAAGHASKTVTSENLLIDTTAPTAHKCLQFDNMGLLNSTVAFEDHLHSQQKVTVYGTTDVLEGVIYELHLFVSKPIICRTVQARLQDLTLSIQVTENWNGSVSVDHKFISTYSGQMNINMYFFRDLKFAQIPVALTLNRCVLQAPSSTENAVLVKQISPNAWSFFSFVTDHESGIKIMQIGAGLTRGGFQIRQLSSITVDSKTSFTFDAPHGSKVFLTLMAENNANLVSYFTSEPVTVDHTRPEITNLSAFIKTHEKFVYRECQSEGNSSSSFDNPTLATNHTLAVDIPNTRFNESNINNTTVSLMVSDIEIQWTVVDLESGILECHCSAGAQPGSTTIHGWKQSRNEQQCKIEDLNIPHGTAVYVHVKCINRVQISHMDFFGPLIVSFETPESDEAKVDFILNNKHSDNHNIPSVAIQSNTSLIHIYWDGFLDVSGISYETRLLSEGRYVSSWRDVDQRTFTSYFVQPHGEGRYLAEVRARNTGDVSSPPINKTILLMAKSPRLTGNDAEVQSTMDGVLFKWIGVFESHPSGEFLYWVTVGSKEGYIDILPPTSTLADAIEVTVNKTKHKTFYLYVTAFAPNAESTTYWKMLYI